jgi:hypothetical protein
MDLKSLTNDQLKALIAEAQAELASRTQELIAYKHDCFARSGNHLSRYKHWAKLVKSVDTSKATGYAWIGEFLPIDRESMIPAGSVVVEVCGDVLTVYRVSAAGKETLGSAPTFAPSKVIAEIAKIL